MTVEELETELAEAQVVITQLVDHSRFLAETIRQNATDLLPLIRKQNEAYKAHANFLTIVEKEMRAYVERISREETTGTTTGPELVID